jgi:hypothetical protein
MSTSEDTARNLRDIEVLDTSGKPVRLGDFWSDEPAAVVFIRHYG